VFCQFCSNVCVLQALHLRHTCFWSALCVDMISMAPPPPVQDTPPLSLSLSSFLHTFLHMCEFYGAYVSVLNYIWHHSEKVNLNLVQYLSILVNWLKIGLKIEIYCTFNRPMATKALYILPHIHPFIHSYTDGDNQTIMREKKNRVYQAWFIFNWYPRQFRTALNQFYMWWLFFTLDSNILFLPNNVL